MMCISCCYRAKETKVLDRPAGLGEWGDKLNSYGETFDRLFSGAQAGAHIVESSLRLAGKSSAAATKAEGLIMDGRDILGGLRIIGVIENVFSGKAFFQTNDNGSFKRVRLDENGKPEYDKNGDPVSPGAGDKSKILRKSLPDLVMSVACAVARACSFILALAKCGVYKLGAHSKRLGHTIMSMFAIATAIDFAQCMRDLSQAGKKKCKEIRETVMNAIQSFLDLLALLPEFGIFMGGHPVMKLAGAVVMLGASIFSFFKGFMEYKWSVDSKLIA